MQQLHFETVGLAPLPKEWLSIHFMRPPCTHLLGNKKETFLQATTPQGQYSQRERERERGAAPSFYYDLLIAQSCSSSPHNTQVLTVQVPPPSRTALYDTDSLGMASAFDSADSAAAEYPSYWKGATVVHTRLYVRNTADETR